MNNGNNGFLRTVRGEWKEKGWRMRYEVRVEVITNKVDTELPQKMIRALLSKHEKEDRRDVVIALPG